MVVSGERRLDAIELDRDLRTRLLAAFSTYPGFTLHSADALNFDFAVKAVQVFPSYLHPSRTRAKHGP